ncbi:XrtA/PEP-CTERM system TPR-repeat protein PrsT [Paucibacter sp. DJ2R-2]|uniref:XrtA/PEP-CTERM system TPR-repeat protein PrsT n=1 Tax=Paucibacter sp. DJ2R-2 TaxID=2893558 RepID=UPI0021E50698|nr:XrtA/PEP-CTERM system TPR-repeat protein PrsT [Paucibacter sp. DJ2R-2]MCV2421509.1 PEP-CTERM system TPR-repeat protein PrsT [Paucibacter sp. DJ4R-1]MCV2438214.1 PEP-CTERM system TPR-repeat protein PrsT [Paucibacter sp. DJ2R-2]
MSTPKLIATSVLTACLLAACGGESYDSLMASARGSIGKGDHKTAIIQLKNALQKSPEAAEARFLLGQAFLAAGDSRSAEVELGKALALKASADQVLPVLARAMIANDSYKALIEQHGGTRPGDAKARADLLTSLAIAYESTGAQDKASAAIAEALQAQPDFPATQILQVRMKARDGDFAGALQMLDALLQREPKLAEGWRLKGDILMVTRRVEAAQAQAAAASAGKPLDKAEGSKAAEAGGQAAVAAYRQALALQPGDVSAHTGLLNHWLDSGDLPAAAEQLAALKKVLAGHPQTLYFEALLTFRQREFSKARELSQQLLKMAPENPLALQLGGAIEFELKGYVQAEEYLGKALKISPNLGLARRMLTQVYLLTGRPAKAVAALQPLLQGASPIDAQLYSLAGEAYRQNGDDKKAAGYFAQAAKLNPADTRSRTQLALGRGASASAEDVLAELKSISDSDPSTVADVALIRAHLQRRDLDKALAAIAVLERKQPDKPMAHNLRGLVFLARRDTAGARKSLEQALKIDPKFYPAAALLASLDINDKQPAAAKQRFETLLVADPDNVNAQLALAELAEQRGAPKAEIEAMINKAIASKPSAAAPRVALIDFQLKERNLKAALSAAEQGIAAMPESADLMEAQGRARTVAGEYQQALESFNALSRAMPRSPLPSLRLAEVYAALKKYPTAISNLKHALELSPDNLVVQRRLGELQLANGEPKEALATAALIQKRAPASPLGYSLEGDVQANQKAWPAAAAAMRRSLEKAPDPAVASKLHLALSLGGAKAEADKHAQDWLKAHPNDAEFLFYLGGVELNQGQLAAAEGRFAAVQKLQPENPAVLNNLAWLAMKLNKPGGLALAEKAVQIAPKQPAFLDTLSSVLEADNKLPRAIEVQVQALELQPQNHDLRMRLAKLYLKAGDKRLAAVELNRLATSGKQYGNQAEVQQLLRGL